MKNIDKAKEFLKNSIPDDESDSIDCNFLDAANKAIEIAAIPDFLYKKAFMYKIKQSKLDDTELLHKQIEYVLTRLKNRFVNIIKAELQFGYINDDVLTKSIRLKIIIHLEN